MSYNFQFIRNKKKYILPPAERDRFLSKKVLMAKNRCEGAYFDVVGTVGKLNGLYVPYLQKLKKKMLDDIVVHP